MKNKLYILLVFTSLAFFAWAQQHNITWETLSNVSYTTLGGKKAPIFGAKVNQLDGKIVQITGYLLPLDVDGNAYFLSKFPFAACFFCNTKNGKQAGAETVIELKLKKQYKWLQMDDIVTFKGTLAVNNVADSNEIFYTLEDAEVGSKW